MGILKPTSGKIIFNGEDITNLSIDKRSKLGMSYAFQQPVKFKGLTVKDIISLATNKEATVADACKYLSDVGLCARDYIDRDIDDSLSGGELKRIEIATIIARASKAISSKQTKAITCPFASIGIKKTIHGNDNKTSHIKEI